MKERPVLLTVEVTTDLPLKALKHIRRITLVDGKLEAKHVRQVSANVVRPVKVSPALPAAIPPLEAASPAYPDELMQ